jgi:gas vesicle protein
MKTNSEFKFPYFLAGMGMGAIAGLLFAPRPGGETRKKFRERSTKSLDTLNQRVKKLRESAEGMMQKGKVIMSRHCCDSIDTSKEAEKKVEEESRKVLGG